MSRRSRASHHVVARARIRTHDDRLLLVLPVRRKIWYLPGGLVEHGEAPGAGCDREVDEELHLRSLTHGELLATTWTEPVAPDSRSWLTYFFDYGRHDPQFLIANVHLARAELDDWALMTYDDALTALQPTQAELLHAAHTGVRYLEQRRNTKPRSSTPHPGGTTMTYLQPNAFLSGGNTTTMPLERRLMYLENVTPGSTVKIEVGGARQHFIATHRTIYEGAWALRVFDWEYRTANAE